MATTSSDRVPKPTHNMGWPAIKSRFSADPALEARVWGIGASMSAVSFALKCFIKSGAENLHIDVPFGVLASPPFSAAFAEAKIGAGMMDRGADLSCASLGAP